VKIVGDIYEVTVVGEGDPPDENELADLVDETVDGPFTLEVRVIPETVETIERP